MTDIDFTIPSFTWEEYVLATLLPNPHRYVFDTTGETAAYVNFNIATGIAYSYVVGGDTWFSFRMAMAMSRAPSVVANSVRASPTLILPAVAVHTAVEATSDVLSMQAQRAASIQTGGASTPPEKPWWMPLPVFVAIYG